MKYPFQTGFLIYVVGLSLGLTGLLGYPREAFSQEEEEETLSDFDIWGVEPDDLKGAWSWKKLDFSGEFEMQYEGRFVDDDDGEGDHDLRQRLRLEISPLFHEKVSLNFYGRLSEDIDGGESRVDIFRSVEDALDSSVDLKIFNLYLGFEDMLLDDSLLTIGRQYNLAPETVLFDGIRYEKHFRDFHGYAYFGRRQSFYSNAFDDPVWGAGVGYHPFRYTFFNIDYAHIEENGTDNDLTAFSLRQQVTDYVNLFARYEFIDERPRDIRMQANFNIYPLGLFVDVSYFRAFSTIREESNNVTSFFEVLGPLFPYEDWQVTVTKSFLEEKIIASAGLQIREVLDSDEIGQFNRDFDRYFASVAVDDIWKGINLEAVWERWTVDDTDEEKTNAVSVELSKNFNDRIDVSLGTDFIKYKVEFADIFEEFQETIDVRTFYANFRCRVRDDQTLRIGYQYEEDDSSEDPFHKLDISYAIEF